MTGKTRWIILGVILTPLVFLAVATAWASSPAQGEVGTQAALGTTFTYQGELKKGGQLVSGDCEMAFRLYDQETMGSQVGSAITKTVSISNSLFTVKLDFGSGVFNGDARWLGIQVKCPGDADFTDLGRQELTAAPYALGVPWDGVTGVPAASGDITGTYPALTVTGLYGRPVTNTIPAAGQVLGWNGSMWIPTTTSGDATILRPGFSLTTVDSEGNPGVWTSIAIGVDGLALISHRDNGAGDLRVTHCNDIACTSTTNTTLDSVGDVADQTSMAIGADGLGLIAYIDGSNRTVKVAHCDNIACTSATISTIASSPNPVFPSVSIGTDGLGLISFSNHHSDLRVAHCDNIACTSATVTILDTGCGMFTSVTIGADGLGLISYTNYCAGYVPPSNLRVAHCSNIACTSAITSTLDSSNNVGWYNSVTVGSDGLGLISYYDYNNNTVKVAHCDNITCTSAAITTIDTGGTSTSVTIGSDGLGLIAYKSLLDDLKVAHCDNLACTSSTIAAVDTAGDVGDYNSVTIGTDGMPLISYFDNTGGIANLKVAHCSNVFCIPYFRRW